MELQPLPDHTVRLFVTTRGEPAHRFAVCVQGNDSIAEVREALQHALRVLPDFPQEASITTIEFEYDGHDYVLTDLIRVNEMFGTGSAKLKVRVDIRQENEFPFSGSQSAGGQKLTDQGRSPIETIAGSPAKSPFVRRNTSPLKKNSVIGAASDDDVELIRSSNPVTSSVPVPSFSAAKENAVDVVKFKGYSTPCKSLFQIARNRDPAESPARTDVPTAAMATSTLPPVSSLAFHDFQIVDTSLGKCTATHMSPVPPSQRGTAHAEDGMTSVPDVTQHPFPEPPGPSVMSLEEVLEQDIVQENQDTGGTAEEQGTPQKGKLHNTSREDKPEAPSGNSQEEGHQQDIEQRNQDTGATAEEQGTPQKGKLVSNSPEDGLGGPSGNSWPENIQQEVEQGNQGTGGPAEKQETPQKSSKSPQKFTRVFQMGEDQPAPVEPTGSQDTNASCETASQPYRKPSKRKPGAGCSELHESLGNGAPHSPPTRKRERRPDCASTAIHSAPSTGGQLGDAIMLNGSEGLDLPSNGAEDSRSILPEVPDTLMSTVTHRQENGDGRRRKKRKSKRNKQDRGDEQPVNEELEGATAPVENPSVSEQVGGSFGNVNGSLTGAPLQASQEEENRPEVVTEGSKPLTQDPEHPEHTPVSKRRRRLTKKHSSLHSDVEGFLFTDTLTPRAVNVNGEGSKSLVAFVEEEHMPASIEGSAVHRQEDNTGSKYNKEQGQVPETVQDGRLLRVATPIRSSPRKVKPVSETAAGNEVQAAQENHEKPSADSSGDNTRLEEKGGKRKRKKGSESGRGKKKGEQGISRRTPTDRKETEIPICLSDSQDYSPNESLKDMNGEDELSDGAKRATPRRSRKPRDKSTENKPAPDNDAGRVPCRYMLLGCQKTYLYKTSAYYLHARSCVYKGDCPSP